VVTQKQVDERNNLRRSWLAAIERLKRKREKELALGQTEKVIEREIGIQKFHDRLAGHPEIQVQGEDESVLFPQQELDIIRNKCIEKLNSSMILIDGERIIDMVSSDISYSSAMLEIWKLVSTRDARISGIIEDIRNKIRERGFDIFISCKSQDYALAHGLYDYLEQNGFKPFLADNSIKEVGIDQFTALIGEVIDICQNMIVLASNPDYVATSYVTAEWHTFVNDINTGHKPNAKLVTVLTPNVDSHTLPAWLRDKQSFTTENYKDDLLYFLK
jgi:hypothetical protein